jgi:hypothetical protein
MSQVFSGHIHRLSGMWDVIVDVPNISFNQRWPGLTYRAVVDDFGTLVAVGDKDGRVVMR